MLIANSIALVIKRAAWDWKPRKYGKTKGEPEAGSPELLRSESLERIAQRELKCPRSASVEELSCRFERCIESWGVDGVAESGVVPVRSAADVGDIEDIERFGNRLQRMRLLEMKCPGEAHVEGVKVVAEVDFLEIGLG